MYTSARVSPIPSMSCVRSCPARPTNGSPRRSSCSPGPSPTNIRSAVGASRRRTRPGCGPAASLHSVHVDAASATSAKRRTGGGGGMRATHGERVGGHGTPWGETRMLSAGRPRGTRRDRIVTASRIASATQSAAASWSRSRLGSPRPRRRRSRSRPRTRCRRRSACAPGAAPGRTRRARSGRQEQARGLVERGVGDDDDERRVRAPLLERLRSRETRARPPARSNPRAPSRPRRRRRRPR